MITTNDIIKTTGDPSFDNKDFEELYINTRKKENRLYTDEQVGSLPLIDPLHVHYGEWELRKRSAARLITYLEKKNSPLSILEVGCGNGWLAAKLASINNASVVGYDINKTELEQAKKVFGKKMNLSFVTGSLSDIDRKFDVIVFAASIQYFPVFEEAIKTALSLLNKNGEIHILDSYFYEETAIEKARQRSLLYYRSIECEEMADYYFHHSEDSLRSFNYRILFDPRSFRNRFSGSKDPFPWIGITTT